MSIDAILGIKGEMGQAFVDGIRVPTTTVEVPSCVVTQVKNEKNDGYEAVQLGIGKKKVGKYTKPVWGHIKKTVGEVEVGPKYMREIRLTTPADVKPGDAITASLVFSVGDKVMVTGVSKGKGFAGGVKRWGFHGGPKTHGQSDRPRSPGSIGQGTTPGRVFKGKKMAGRMGSETVTVKGLKVILINEETGEMKLSGLVPGIKRGLLIIKKQ